MTQAPYSWTFAGNCPSCGSPIYGRVRKPGHRPIEGAGGLEMTEPWLEAEEPEARRTCPPRCLYSPEFKIPA